MAITRGTLQIARRLRRDIGTEVDQVVRDLTTAWIKAWDRLANPWQLAAADLVAEAIRLEHWPRPTDIARLPQVIAALDASERALQGLARQTADAAIAGAKRVIDADVEFEARIIASQAPATEQEGLLQHLNGRLPVAEQDQDTVRLQVNSRIRTNAVDVMRNRTAGQITADTFPLAPDAAESMRRELIRGIDVGANPREAAARMVANTEGAFNGGLSRAMVISRTEMLDAYRATSQQIHAANSDIVPAWEWLAELGPRVCPSCLSLHGTVYPVSQPGPDDHPTGRCARLPVLSSWAELGIRAPEPPSDVPDAEEWFNNLPRSTQLQIMGPGRLQLLENGSIGWGDLSKIRQNPGWRPSRIPTPLRELRQRVQRGLAPTPRVVAPRARAVPPARLATPTLPIPRLRPRIGTPTLPIPRQRVPVSVRQPGRDLAPDITPATFRAMANRAGQQSGYGDHLLTELTTLQRGWNNPAQVVSAARLDEAIRAGWTPVWRGVERREYADQMRTGDWRMGHGLYGDGVYLSTRRTTAEHFRGATLADPDGDHWGPDNEWTGGFDVPDEARRGLIRVAVDPNARLADYHELRDEWLAWLRLQKGQLWVDEAMDFSWWAVTQGYDGVVVGGQLGVNDGSPYPPGVHNLSEATQYVIFNRSVLMIERASGRYDP